MPQTPETFQEIIHSRPLTSTRKMFGGMGGFVKETMFAIFDSGGKIYLRFNEADREGYLQVEGTHKFGNMREYVRVPEAVLADELALDEWLDKSYQYGLTVPPRKKRRR